MSPMSASPGPHGGRSVTARARGHPDIRATHTKSLELTADPLITSRATCVVGVEAHFDPVAWAMLRGEVHVALRVDDRVAHGSAVVNPVHEVSGRIVLRRGDFRDADTFAVEATLTAADLPRDLAGRLVDETADVVLTVTELEPPPPLVMLAPADGPPPQGRIGLLWQAADTLVDLDRAPADFDGHTVAVRLPYPLRPLPEPAAGWLEDARRRGARFLAVDPACPQAASTELSVLLAAGHAPVPAVHLGQLDHRSAWQPAVPALLHAAPAPTVVTAPADLLASLLADLPAGHQVAVPDTVVDLGVTAEVLSAEAAAAELDGRGDRETTVVVTGGVTDRLVPLDAVTAALTAAGLPRRAVADALRPLGVSRRDLYDTAEGQR